MNAQPLPLAGIRVVDDSRFLAGPCLSRCLAALGSEDTAARSGTHGRASGH